MAVEDDVFILDVIKVLMGTQINVKDMEEAQGVQIV
jgi:hypothetical protein